MATAKTNTTKLLPQSEHLLDGWHEFIKNIKSLSSVIKEERSIIKYVVNKRMRVYEYIQITILIRVMNV